MEKIKDILILLLYFAYVIARSVYRLLKIPFLVVHDVFERIRDAIKLRKKVRTENRNVEHRPQREISAHNDLNKEREDMKPVAEDKQTDMPVVTHEMLYPQIDTDCSWDKVWDVHEFIQNLSELNLEMHIGKEKTTDFDFEVRKARVASALSAFVGITFDDALERLTYFGMINFFDDEVSNERADKIKSALKSPSMNSSLHYRIDNMKIDQDSCTDLLHDLVCSRYSMAHAVSRNMLEGTTAMYIVRHKIEAVYSPLLQAVLDEIDSLLVLLLGDAFGKSFTEKELIENYHYPTVTDRKLRDWCFENY